MAHLLRGWVFPLGLFSGQGRLLLLPLLLLLRGRGAAHAIQALCRA